MDTTEIHEIPAVTLSEFQKDLQDYQSQEKEVIKNFLKGIVQLGGELKRYRDKWKPQQKWIAFLKEAGKSHQAVNQMIRMHEFFAEHPALVDGCGINNWRKINGFLALPDGIREEFLNQNLPEETKEFVQKTDALRGEVVGLMDEMSLDVDVEETDFENIEVGEENMDLENIEVDEEEDWPPELKEMVLSGKLNEFVAQEINGMNQVPLEEDCPNIEEDCLKLVQQTKYIDANVSDSILSITKIFGHLTRSKTLANGNSIRKMSQGERDAFLPLVKTAMDDLKVALETFGKETPHL